MKNTDKLNRHIFIKDNLEVLRTFDSESVDLIYLDPPFNSNKDYNAPIGSESAGAHFKDRWTLDDTDDEWWGELSDRHPALYSAIHAVGVVSGKSDKSYLIYMAMRLLEMKRVLKDTGSIYLHCDQTMSHGLKLVMDSIFGKENFKREVIWQMKSVSGFKSSTKNWIRDHDSILYYAHKGACFNKELLPYREEYIRKMFKTDKDGRKYRQRNNKRYYADEGGVPVGSVWTDIYSMQTITRSIEKVGYPTQKPVALLERIIKASSNEGDLVLDPFCGCATTCIASEKLKRRWIGIDLSEKAGELVKRRTKSELVPKGSQMDFRNLIKDITITSQLPIRNAPKPSKNIKYALYGQQRGFCKGCKAHFEFRHFHKDHIEPLAKGGQDTDSNLQLLCGSCNILKGTGDMAYLRTQLKKHYGYDYLMKKKVA